MSAAAKSARGARRASVFFEIDEKQNGASSSGAASGDKRPAKRCTAKPPETGADHLQEALLLAAEEATHPDRVVDLLESAATLLLAENSGPDGNTMLVIQILAMAARYALAHVSPSKAVELAERASTVRRTPISAEILGWCCMQYASQATDHVLRANLETTAVDSMQLALQLQQQFNSVEHSGATPMLELRAAYVFAATHQSVLALSTLEKTVKARKTEATAYHLLAVLHTSAAELTRAQKALAALFSLYPNDVVGRVLLAAVLHASVDTDGHTPLVEQGLPVTVGSAGTAAAVLLTSALGDIRSLLRYCCGSMDAPSLVGGHEETLWSEPAALAVRCVYHLVLLAEVAVVAEPSVCKVAIELALEAISQGTAVVPQEVLAQLLATQGRLHLGSKNLKEAREVGEQAVAASMLCVDAHIVTGRAVFEAATTPSETAESPPTCEALIEPPTQISSSAASLAMSMFDAALRLEPSNEEAQMLAAECLSSSGDHDAAATFLLSACANDINRPLVPLQRIKYLLE